MTGTLALLLRMALYFTGASLATLGFVSFDAEANTITVNLDDLAVILAGLGTFLGTFAASRIVKRKGGVT